MMTRVWAIALAAGAGTRLADVSNGVPKQFWHPTGRGSLIEDTLDRLYPIVVPRRVVTVVDESHRPFIRRLNGAALGDVRYQRCNRGTAVGVLVPLLRILAEDPGATVIITPTDHGMAAMHAFRRGLVRAIEQVRAGTSELVLFGAVPTEAATDLGWISTGTACPVTPETFQPIEAFVEKPASDKARELLRSRSVWNTMLMVADGAALLDRFRQHLPVLTDLLGGDAEWRVHGPEFPVPWQRLPTADFSRDLLAVTRPLTLYTWPAGCGWTDLGTPERLHRWLREYAPFGANLAGLAPAAHA